MKAGPRSVFQNVMEMAWTRLSRTSAIFLPTFKLQIQPHAPFHDEEAFLGMRSLAFLVAW